MKSNDLIFEKAGNIRRCSGVYSRPTVKMRSVIKMHQHNFLFNFLAGNVSRIIGPLALRNISFWMAASSYKRGRNDCFAVSVVVGFDWPLA